MEQQGQFNASRMVESLSGWWKLAGVDNAVDELPVNLLDVGERNDTADKLPLSTQPAPVVAKVNPSEPKLEWPTDVEKLRELVVSGAPLPGNGFGTRHLPSAGPSKAEVMLVSDVPDEEDFDRGSLTQGTSGQLLRRMMHAIGVDLDKCHWVTLATTRPYTGEIPESEYADLAKFMLHQIEIIRPGSVILLGSTASFALLGEELMKARQNLGNINHGGITLPVLTTFHPRTLIARPALKAQAWRDLQMFAKRSQV